jgi:hypothetical protein
MLAGSGIKHNIEKQTRGQKRKHLQEHVKAHEKTRK